MLTRSTSLSALLTTAAAGLALAAPDSDNMMASSLGLAAVASGLSMRELVRGSGKPETAALMLMIQAIILTEGICVMSAKGL
jgi:hypothetical protein